MMPPCSPANIGISSSQCYSCSTSVVCHLLGHVQELIQVHTSVGELPEGTLLLDLGIRLKRTGFIPGQYSLQLHTAIITSPNITVNSHSTVYLQSRENYGNIAMVMFQHRVSLDTDGLACRLTQPSGVFSLMFCSEQGFSVIHAVNMCHCRLI